MEDNSVPFYRPFLTGQEFKKISELSERGRLAGDGYFTKKCSTWLENTTGSGKALLTHSCTAALEMMAVLVDIQPGDEVIMPSYTFVSTANAFVLRGAVPIFVDIREDTLNINEKLVEGAITRRTKLIVVVHYAGVSCEMDTLISISRKYNVSIVEDAAQGIMASYKDRPLGGIGDLGAYSFHETKNVISGEGGALLVNSEKFSERAEIVREKGTNRTKFFRGEVDKYTWLDIGSSYLPSELIAAFLLAQLEKADYITSERIKIWNIYHNLLLELERKGLVRRPIVPDECQHNAHMYYVLLPLEFNRNIVLTSLKQAGITAMSHYVPLHTSPAGEKFGRASGVLDNTIKQSERIIRLPLWVGLSIKQQEYIVEKLASILD